VDGLALFLHLVVDDGLYPVHADLPELVLALLLEVLKSV
jgi:hypothetical protein